MNRSFSIAAFAASLLSLIPGCGDERVPEPSHAALTLPAAASALAAAPAPPRSKLATHEGGALVRAPSSDALYLADEDHSAVRRIELPVMLPAPKAPPAVSATASASASAAP